MQIGSPQYLNRLARSGHCVKFVGSGKVKDIYEHEEGLVFRFSDRVSAFDVPFREPVPGKGEVLCGFAEYWFGRLPARSHFVRRLSGTEILVRRLEMIPLECVVRGYLYGSLAERVRRGTAKLPPGSPTRLASRLPRPVFDPTTKAEHDEPVSRAGAVSAGLVDDETFAALEAESLRIYDQMHSACLEAGFVMADLKLEFGIGGDGRPVLADSIGPDEFRLWPASSYEPGRVQESYDKQILRDWLVSEGHAARFERERAAGIRPEPPAIPQSILSQMTERYREACRLVCS